MVWAVSLSTTKLSPRRLTRAAVAPGIRGLVGCGKHDAPWPIQRLTPWGSPRGCPSRHFGENQLSPGSFSISPLSTAPPPDLHLRWVRASTGHYPRFTLAMDSSPGFGSTVCDTSDALFRLAFAVAA
jgi:hypothetical protein